MLRKSSLLIAPCLAVLGLAPSACAGERHATPSTLDSVFSSADGGDTILLASGDYGTFEGGAKDGRVTLKAEPGATPRIALKLSRVENLTFTGLRITDLELAHARNITVS